MSDKYPHSDLDNDAGFLLVFNAVCRGRDKFRHG